MQYGITVRNDKPKPTEFFYTLQRVCKADQKHLVTFCYKYLLYFYFIWKETYSIELSLILGKMDANVSYFQK